MWCNWAENILKLNNLKENVEKNMQKFIIIKNCRQIILNQMMNEKFDRINYEKKKKIWLILN